MTGRASRWLCGLLAAASCLGAGDAAGQTRYDARLRFRVVRTPHFVIYYHQREERLAARLAGMVEDVRRQVAAQLALDAPAVTHVVLVDQTDISNGWSTPLPYNTIELAAVPPSFTSVLGNYDDWLRLLLAHEYAHVVHLSCVGGWMRAFRTTLGRHPISFPNLFLPAWHVEGIATFVESAVTGRGRVDAPETRAIQEAIANSGRTMPIDRAGGGLVRWPGGNTPYFYGGAFAAYLAERHGSNRLGELARATSARVPLFGEGAFRKIFGAPSRALWRRFQLSLNPGSGAAADGSGLRRISQNGYMSAGPRYVPGVGPGPRRVVYSSLTPDRFPGVLEISEDRLSARTVTTRYLGESLSSDGRWVFFDQIEFSGAVARLRDLYAADLTTGARVRLSHAARMSDPDVTGDGARIALVVQRTGDSALMVYRLARQGPGRAPRLDGAPLLTVAEDGCRFATPRWSSDMSRLAAVRQCDGSPPGVVTIDARSGLVRSVTSDSRTRAITPAWSPDGSTILFASDRDGARFQIFAVPADSASATDPWLVVAAPGGATSPDIAPDGRSIVFVSATAAGYEVFEAPLNLHAGVAAARPGRFHSDIAPGDPGRPLDDDPAAPVLRSRRYSPWPTLWPRAWSPVVIASGRRTDIGGTVEGGDVLGRHAYHATATWTVARPAADARIALSARPNFDVAYVYGRWRQSLLLSASDTLETVTLADGATGRLFRADARSGRLFAGVLASWPRVRLSGRWLTGVVLERQRFAPSSARAPRDRSALRSAWALDSSREYGYSISAEHGVRASATLEHVTRALGADGTATSATADLRAYLPGGAVHSVIAVRAAVGVSTGDRSVRRLFGLGGSSTPLSPFDFGQQAVGMLRGVPADSRSGSALVAASLDYRFPVLRVERGVGTWPLFVDSVHGAVFADAGSSGGRLATLGPPVTSVGAELSSDLTIAYALPVTVTVGAAWTRDPGRRQADRVAVFLRIGRAF